MSTLIIQSTSANLPYLKPQWIPSLFNIFSNNRCLHWSWQSLGATHPTSWQQKYHGPYHTCWVFQPKDIQWINYCCLYLQISTLSDMCLSDGYLMDPSDITTGDLKRLLSTSNWLSAKQAQTSKQVWLFWQTYVLPIWFDNNNDLYSPLGPWTHTAATLCCQWHAYYNFQHNFLYVLHDQWSTSSTIACLKTAKNVALLSNPSGTQTVPLSPSMCVAARTNGLSITHFPKSNLQFLQSCPQPSSPTTSLAYPKLAATCSNPSKYTTTAMRYST